MRIWRILTLLLVLQGATSAGEGGKTAAKVIYLSLDKLDWSIQIGAAHLVVEKKEVLLEGKGGRLHARDFKTDMIISVVLEEMPQSMSNEECRDFYRERAKGSPLPKDDIRKSTFGDMAAVEYIVQEPGGVKTNQKHIKAYFAKGNYGVEIHLWKQDFKDVDQKLFRSMLESIGVVNKNSKQTAAAKYALSKKRFFSMSVPMNWGDTFEKLSGGEALVCFTAPDKKIREEMLISFSQAPPGREKELSTAEDLKEFLVTRGKSDLARAVEKAIAIRELKGKNTVYHYSLTEKTATADEYKYLTTGASRIGDFLVVFRLRSNEEPSEAIERCLEMISATTINSVESDARDKKEMSQKPSGK